MVENDYILSANAYNPHIGGEEKEHRNLKEILKEIEEVKNDSIEILKNIFKLLD